MYVLPNFILRNFPLKNSRSSKSLAQNIVMVRSAPSPIFRTSTDFRVELGVVLGIHSKQKRESGESVNLNQQWSKFTLINCWREIRVEAKRVTLVRTTSLSSRLTWEANSVFCDGGESPATAFRVSICSELAVNHGALCHVVATSVHRSNNHFQLGGVYNL